MGTYVRGLARPSSRRVQARARARQPVGGRCRPARDLPHVSLDGALRVVHLYAEKESPKFEKVAMRWLERYLDERSPTLKSFANWSGSSTSVSSIDDDRLYRRGPRSPELRLGEARRCPKRRSHDERRHKN